MVTGLGTWGGTEGLGEPKSEINLLTTLGLTRVVVRGGFFVKNEGLGLLEGGEQKRWIRFCA